MHACTHARTASIYSHARALLQGCDGSVLIDSTPGNKAEKDSAPNFPSLRFFDVVDRAKAALEAQCPGVVSCADVLAFAARDSVVLSGGLGYQVPAGRRDGRVSTEADALNNLPGPTSTASDLVAGFAAKNLTVEDIVVLSGAHTIGVSHCSSFTERIYNFPNTTDGIDPKLSKAYAFLLKGICPPNTNPDDDDAHGPHHAGEVRQQVLRGAEQQPGPLPVGRGAADQRHHEVAGRLLRAQRGGVPDQVRQVHAQDGANRGALRDAGRDQAQLQGHQPHQRH
uniref:Peroxidase n=1 Tax=Aegilops tauschii subsp. strangulata TaxID=200361 RepID=A0A452Y2S6_AEGTS